MLFFGIDLSLSETGMSVIDEDGYHDTMIYKTVPKIKKKNEEDIIIPDEQRISKISHKVMEFILSHDATKEDKIYIEGMAVMATGTAVHRLAGLNYYVRVCLYKSDYQFHIVPPSTLKKFVLQKHNKKGTKKQQMLLHIYKRWGQEFNNDNMADAFALAQYGRYQNGFGDENE